MSTTERDPAWAEIKPTRPKRKVEKYDWRVSSYQNEEGFYPLKAKASGRALATPDNLVQIAARMKVFGPEGPISPTTDEILVLYVTKMNGFVFMDVRRFPTGEWIVHEWGDTEADTYQRVRTNIDRLFEIGTLYAVPNDASEE